MSSAVTKVTLEQCQAKVTEIDADGDGLISKTELQMREYVRDTMMIGWSVRSSSGAGCSSTQPIDYMMNGGSLSDEEVDDIFNRCGQQMV
jgi:Ca2+-binding EF-hand superfamily protein